jgi:hypothetical protein
LTSKVLSLQPEQVKDEKENSPKFERRGRFLLRRTLSIDLADEDTATQHDKVGQSCCGQLE